MDSDLNGDPQLTLVCFAVNGKQTLTQVLFFKFGSRQLDFRQATRKLAVTRDRLNIDRAAIAARVDSFTVNNLQSIDL